MKLRASEDGELGASSQAAAGALPGEEAGLQPRAVDVDDAGTVMNFWVPKDKLPASTEPEPERKKEAKGDSSRLAVVLLHGFAGDGIFTWALQVVLHIALINRSLLNASYTVLRSSLQSVVLVCM